MLARLISLLRAWLAPAPKARRSRTGSMLEPLEQRIAPAMLVSPHIVTYTDESGDLATVKSSAAIFTPTNYTSILTFSTTSMGQQLQTIELGSMAAGDNISVTVKSPAGKLPSVGLIHSSLALGKVVVQGDLEAIQAGTSNISGSHYTGLGSLTVNSFGTQGAANAAVSEINGNVGSITIKGNMGLTGDTFTGPQIIVSTNSAGITNTNGNVGSITIGGDLIGGANSLDGSFTVQGNVGTVAITGSTNALNGMVGGAGNDSASFQIGGRIGKFSVSNITGGAGVASASIVTGTQDTVAGIGSLTVKGSVTGGSGQGSAFIGESAPGSSPTVFTGGAFGTIKIGGALTGGSGANSAEINANSFGAITIGSGIVGGTGVTSASSGLISSVGGIASLTINSGGIVGGTANDSGSVMASTSPTNAAKFGSITVHGDITGNATAVDTITGAGQISAQSSIGSVTVYGSLMGSSSVSSGSIIDSEAIGHVTLKAEGGGAGSLIGGTGSKSGEITALSISSVNIAGQITGDTATGASSTDIGTGSGRISTSESVGSITLGDGLVGGIGAGSGALDIGSGFGAHLTSLIIKSGGITAGTGASSTNSGLVDVGGTIGSINLNGSSITAGATAAAGSGGILSSDNVGSISIGSLVLDAGAGTGAGQISVGGNLSSLKFTGAAADTGMVNVAGSVGSISVKGNVGDVASTIDSAGSFVIGGAVKSISISGSLLGGKGTDSGAIFAGLDDIGKIGSLTVTGDIIGNASTTSDGSGQVFGGGGITKVSIGNLIGGGSTSSGSISSDGALGTISVKGAQGIVGGAGDGSGQISAGSTIKTVNVTGSLMGEGGTGSGSIVSHSLLTPSRDVQGDIGSITVKGLQGIMGGNGADSGQISAAGNIGSVTISAGVTGAAVSGTGAILAGVDPVSSTGGNITTLKIGETLSGAAVPNGASALTVNGSGYIEAAHIGSATIGNIQAGAIGSMNTVTDDGAILASNDITSLTVTGGITGDATNPVVISAVGQANPGKTDLAFGKINIGSGGVTFANILAGYDQTGAGVNGAASIGTVFDGGDWSHSNLVAAVLADNGSFGNTGGTKLIATTDQLSIIPSIASIIIKGDVTSKINGTDDPAGAHTYGFTAGAIKSFSVDGHKQSLSLGVINNVDGSADTDVVVVASRSTPPV